MHRIAGEVQAAISIPVIHIAAETGKAVKEKQLTKIALLGTRYTMELGFYQQELEKYGITTMLPDDADRQYIHDAIYSEMGKNIFLAATREKFLSIINTLKIQGAEAVILGCTEIPILLKESASSIPLFDTTQVHAAAAVAFALAEV